MDVLIIKLKFLVTAGLLGFILASQDFLRKL